jgi:hypothetical protein
MTPVALAPRESDRPTRLLAVSPHSASHARTAAAFASVLPVGGSLTRIAFLCAQRGQRPFRYCDNAVGPFATECCRLQRPSGLRRVELSLAVLVACSQLRASSVRCRSIQVSSSLVIVSSGNARMKPPHRRRFASRLQFTRTRTPARAHTRTHTHTNARTRTHPHRHTLSHTRTRMCIMPLTRMCIMPLYGCTCTHIGTRARTHRTRGRARTRTRTLSLTRTDACRLHAHTQTHKRELNEFVNNM